MYMYLSVVLTIHFKIAWLVETGWIDTNAHLATYSLVILTVHFEIVWLDGFKTTTGSKPRMERHKCVSIVGQLRSRLAGFETSQRLQISL